MTIVSITEASRLGTITDVLFETDPLRVAALRAAGNETDFVVPFELIRNLGSDAVMVESSQVTQMASAASAIGSLLGLQRLQQLKVVDEGGTFVGTVRGARIDPTTGSVVELAARRGGIFGVGGTNTILTAKAIRSVGSDVLTVMSDAVGFEE